MPFFFTGLFVNGLMKVFPGSENKIYAVNLTGSGLGCILAPLLLPVLAGEGVVCVCAALAGLAGLFSFGIYIRHLTCKRGSELIKSGVTILGLPGNSVGNHTADSVQAGGQAGQFHV